MVDRSRQLLGINITFSILSWLFVSLRIYVRGFMRKSFGLDDKLMVITQIFYTIYLGCAFTGVFYGCGHHNADLPVEYVEQALKFWYICELLYVISACFLKVSVGLFLLRITIRPIHVWILRCLILGTVVFGVIYLIIGLIQCNPISNWWKIPRIGCMNPHVVVNANYVGAIMNSIADWTFALLPMFIIQDLHMSRKMKAVVAGILSFAAIGNIGTVIRIPFISTLYHMEDFLWTTTDLAVWSTVEIGIGIVAACAATLRPLLKAITGQRSSDGSFRHQNPIILGSTLNQMLAGSWRNISLNQLGMEVRPVAMGGDFGKNRGEHVQENHDDTDLELGGIQQITLITLAKETETLKASRIKATEHHDSEDGEN